MLHFILADLRRNRVGAAILILLVALATALGVAVTLQERALRLGTARASAPFDLVIGAAGGETQLVLSAIFLQPAPLPLVPASVLAALRADPRVEMAVPVGFGDFVGSHPIVGTTTDAIAMLGGTVDGGGFRHLGDAIAGADVAREIGSSFHPFHGSAGEAGEVHAGLEYTIIGKLAPTGTPWDRAILVPIQAVWEVHADHDHDAEAAAAPALAAFAREDHHHQDDGEHDHDHGEGPAGRPLGEEVFGEGDPGVPAILVKPRSIADAYTLRQEYRRGSTLAVFPGEVLTRLYGTLGDARLVLSVVAAGAQSIVAAAILMVIAVHVLQRRRQIGALRAFGAPRVAILATVWLEVFLVLVCGLLLGFALGFAAVTILAERLAEASGVRMPVVFQPGDAWTLIGFVAIAALATLVPAAIAFRQSPAQALRS